MPKKRKKYLGSVIDITKGGVALGVGAEVVGEVGGETGAFTKIGAFMPAMGTVIGAGFVVDALHELKGVSRIPKKKKRRKKRKR